MRSQYHRQPLQHVDGGDGQQRQRRPSARIAVLRRDRHLVLARSTDRPTRPYLVGTPILAQAAQSAPHNDNDDGSAGDSPRSVGTSMAREIIKRSPTTAGHGPDDA